MVPSNQDDNLFAMSPSIGWRLLRFREGGLLRLNPYRLELQQAAQVLIAYFTL